MPKTKTWIENPKDRGEWAELHFMARAKEEGFRVTKPWGESARYDFAVELGGQFLQVQVKSTICRHQRSYACALHGAQGKLYTAEQVDFFAIYVVPENVWYVVPADIALRLRGTIVLTPARENEKYASYREAWHLMKEALAQQAKDARRAKSKTKPKHSKPQNNQPDETPTGEMTGEPADIADMRGAVETPPSTGFDPDFLRNRLAGCFTRLTRR